MVVKKCKGPDWLMLLVPYPRAEIVHTTENRCVGTEVILSVTEELRCALNKDMALCPRLRRSLDTS